MLFRSSIFLLATLGLASLSAAQDSPPASPATNAPQRAAPQYQVEVLIFTHRDFDPTEEQFALEDRRAPAPEQTLRSLDTLEGGVEFDADAPVSVDTSPPPADGAAPVEPDASAVSDAAAVPESQFTFRVLRPDELQLTNQYRVLARLPGYHPLVHGGWVTLGLPDSSAMSVDLGVLGVANPVGTVRLSLTRFLHLKLDLTYIDTPAAQRVPAAASDDLTELPIAPRYHIDAERTTRSGELHYFDHPAFGVLIKVTPVKANPAATPASRPAA